MLQRKALKQFQAWHDAPSHTALLVTGARQVGKTYLIREFANQHYESFAEFNFIQNPNAARIFNPPSDAATMLMRMELASGQRFIPGKTLIFLDEIQACKEAATAIKFLVDDGRYDFAMSGSLLGVELEDVRSVPVGYQSEVMMFPLDFEEFCWSQNVDAKIFDMLKECYEKKQPVDEFIHEHLMSLFRKYLIIGGMPAAVSSFAQSNSLIDVRQVQEDIKQGYRRDISQYARKENRLHIRSITISFQANSTIPTSVSRSQKSKKTRDSKPWPTILTGLPLRTSPFPHTTWTSLANRWKCRKNAICSNCFTPMLVCSLAHISTRPLLIFLPAMTKLIMEQSTKMW